jgi:hypothetical protein
MFKTFIKGKMNRHYAMKLFLIYEAEDVISPFLMSQAFEEIQKIDIPDDCEEFHSEFLENFKTLTIDEL